MQSALSHIAEAVTHLDGDGSRRDASRMTLPILDATGLTDTHTPPALVEAFREAYSTLGFGCITGHGIDPALRAAVFDTSRRFHALPRAAKEA
ncbi:MAG: 2-oxoglutarate and iron-dependent oxygenase domain-containing protein, partial [Pseudomonadota bacterium]